MTDATFLTSHGFSQEQADALDAWVAARGAPATRADLAEVRAELQAFRVEAARDNANLAAGIGSDIRAIRADLDSMRADIGEIRRLLERRPWWRR